MGRSFALAFTQIVLGITFLAHQAWLMTDAIGRTLVPVPDPPTAARVDDRGPGRVHFSRDVTSVYRRMRAPVILAIAAAAFVALLRPEHAAIAAPFVLVWALSPLATTE